MQLNVQYLKYSRPNPGVLLNKTRPLCRVARSLPRYPWTSSFFPWCSRWVYVSCITAECCGCWLFTDEIDPLTGLPRPGSRTIRIPDEQRLLRQLLHQYDTAARPVYNASHTVTVKFGLTLTQIADMVCFGKATGMIIRVFQRVVSST